MKPIELTHKQKDKLLEMCKILFPKYNFEFASNFTEYGILIICEKGKHEVFENVNHWFEFCTTHLMYKVLGVTNYKDTEAFFMKCLWQCEPPHPIDYLYEEFKKIK